MSKIIENKKQVIEYFEKGSKPRQLWKIGTEHEKFLYHLNTLKPIDYYGKKGVKSLFKLFILSKLSYVLIKQYAAQRFAE